MTKCTLINFPFFSSSHIPSTKIRWQDLARLFICSCTLLPLLLSHTPSLPPSLISFFHCVSQTVFRFCTSSFLFYLHSFIFSFFLSFPWFTFLLYGLDYGCHVVRLAPKERRTRERKRGRRRWGDMGKGGCDKPSVCLSACLQGYPQMP